MCALCVSALRTPRPVVDRLWRKTKWSEGGVGAMIRGGTLAPLVKPSDEGDDTDECPICCIVTPPVLLLCCWAV